MNANNMPNPSVNTTTSQTVNPAEQSIERPDLRPPPQTPPWYRRPTAFYYLVAIGIVAWIIVRSFSTTSSSPSSATTDPPTQSVTGSSPDLFDPKPDAAAAESARKARIAAAKVAQRRTTDLGEEVLTTASEGQFEATQCERELALILDDDSGRRIATKPDLVRAFRAVSELERPQSTEFEKFKTLATTALEPVRKAAANPDDTWDATSNTAKVLTELRSEARSRRDAIRSARARMQSVVSLAQREPAPERLASAKSLREAIRELEQKEAEELATAVHTAREKAREEVKVLLASTAAESIRLAGQAEAKREAAKAEVSRTKIDLEADALKTQAAKERLRAKLKTPEVLQDLAIFTAKGYCQPGQGGTGVFEKTDVFGPVSFTRLKTGGYLDPSADGLKKLLRLGAEPTLSNDRPKWKFNAFRLDQSNEEYLKRVQGLLIELGPLMVEDRLLAR